LNVLGMGQPIITWAVGIFFIIITLSVGTFLGGLVRD
jgi:hypothetical protein